MSFSKRSLAVLRLAFFALALITAPAQDGPKAGKQDPKPAQPAFPFPDIEKMLPAGLTPEQIKELQKQLVNVNKMVQDLAKQLPAALPNAIPGGFPGQMPGFPGGLPGGFGQACPFAPDQNNNRLGAGLNKPSDVLVEQLDLPRGQGLVLGEVRPGSAAAKAGLKANDILLELGGKAVPNEVGNFVKALNQFKTGEKVDAVVLRKGKKETVKGVTLPDPPRDVPNQIQFQFPGAIPGAPMPGGLPGGAFPGGGIPGFQPPGAWNGGGAPAPQIALADGKPQAVPTAYSGAFRIRALPSAQVPQGRFAPAQKGEALIVLDVAGEPRTKGFKIGGAPLIDKAIDDQGQQLTAAIEPDNGQPIANFPLGGFGRPGRIMLGDVYPSQEMVQHAALRLKRGEKPSRSLKEVSGSIPVELLTPSEPLIKVDNILKAAGQTAKGKSGGSIEVKSVEKLANGEYQVKVVLERPGDANNPFGGMGGVRIIQRVQINGQNVVMGGFGGPDTGDNNMPVLLDAKGKAFKMIAAPATAVNFNGNMMTHTLTLLYQPQDGQGEPARLVLNGRRRQL